MPQEWENAPLVEQPVWQTAPLATPVVELGQDIITTPIEGAEPRGVGIPRGIKGLAFGEGEPVDLAGIQRRGYEMRGIAVGSLDTSVLADVSAWTMGEPEDYSTALDGAETRRDPETGSILYLNPETKRWTTVTDPTSVVDLVAYGRGTGAELVGEGVGAVYGAGMGLPVSAASAAVGAIGGGTIGAASESPIVGIPAGALIGGATGFMASEAVATATGAILGSFSTTLARLKAGQALGKNNYTDDEIFSKVLTNAMLAGAGGLAGEAISTLGRRLFSTPEARQFLKSMSPEDIDNALVRMQPTIDEIKAKTGEDWTPTLSQLMRADRPNMEIRQVTTMENRIASNTDELVQTQNQQMQVEEQLFNNLNASGDLGQRAAIDLAESTQGVAQQKVRTQLSEAEDFAEGLIAREQTYLNDLFESPDLDLTAEGMQEVLDATRSRVRNSLGEEYGKFWNTATDDIPLKDLEVSLEGLRGKAESWRDILDSDIFKSLAVEDRAAVQNAVTAGSKQIDGAVIDVPQSLSVVSRAISVLKAEKRNIQSGEGQARLNELPLVNSMLKDLTTVRDDALRSVSPEAVDALKALDIAYRESEERLAASMINRVLAKGGAGEYAVTPSDAVSYLIGSDGRAARYFMKFKDDPNSLAFASRGSVVDGIRSLYSQRVLNGVLTHDAFMDANRVGMKRIMTANEYKVFANADRAKAGITAAQKELEIATDNINRTFEGALGAEQDMGNLVNYISRQDDSLRATNRLKTMLKDSPELWEDFQAQKARSIADDIQTRKRGGLVEYNTTKINRYLENSDELKAAFGEQYVADLRLFRDFVEMGQPLPGVRLPREMASTVTGKNLEGAEGLVRRAIIGPLSRIGFVLTGVRDLTGDASQKIVGRMLANPKALAQDMRLYRRGTITRNTEALIATLGMDDMIERATE